MSHFEQRLLIQWKERLRHPLTSFQEALTQARLAEAAAKQLLPDQSMAHPSQEIKRKSVPTVPSGRKTPGDSPKDTVRCYSCQETGHMAYQCPRTGQLRQVSSNTRKRGDVQCYHCGRRGHYLSDCPQLMQRKPQEAKKNPVMSRTSSITSRSTAITPQAEVAAVETIDKMIELLKGERDRAGDEWQELEKLRLQERTVLPQDACPPTDHVDTIHTMSSPPSPLPYAQVGIEGVLVNAMLDTGSSVTILDEDILVAIARTTSLDKSMIDKPAVQLHDYSEKQILVVACVNLRITAEGRQITERVYIVKQAQPTCLLGIAAIRKLGLATFANTVRFSPVHDPVETDTSSGVSTKITVRLVTQVRVPAQSGVEVTGSVQRLCLGSRDGLRLFEPDSQWMGKQELEAEESLVTVSQTGDVQVILKNPGELRVPFHPAQRWSLLGM